jgi:hypothetical protein
MEPLCALAAVCTVVDFVLRAGKTLVIGPPPATDLF